MESQLFDKIRILKANIEKAFMGKSDVVRTTLVGFFASGHILIEDVPGVGKTLLARALARSVDCSFNRIQFTPDLLPSDILGVSIYNNVQDRSVFKAGPIFKNIILADEINRATPRTQSSLLEAMNDFQVSVDGITHPLLRPFMVIATQNPFEFEGIYPLPESQLDRFLLCLRVGYPSREDEKRILEAQRLEDPIDGLKAVLSVREVIDIQKAVRKVRMEESLIDYIMQIVTATREITGLAAGVSPRGTLFLRRVAQASAILEGRDFVVPDDIQNLSLPVLAHRLILKDYCRGLLEGEATDIIQRVLDSTPVPM